MSLLHILSYAGAAAAFLFVTLSLASGLLWLSELIEEHTRIAKLVGQRSIYIIIALHIVLYFSESLPLKHTLFSVFCHVVYLQNFTFTWPLISLTSPSFIASCLLVISDHFMWFFYFARITQEARHKAHRSYGSQQSHGSVPGFADIATFFGLCVWLVPLFLFLSLSANDNALPTNSGHGSVPTTPTAPARPMMARSRGSLFRSLFDSLPQIRPRPRRHGTSDGLIAPHSPNIIRSETSTSPAHTPTPMQRVPSLHSLPPPLISPTRRTSSEYHLDAGANDSSDHLTPFRLGTPPRRVTTVGTPPRRPEGRLEMRRAASAYGSGNPGTL